MKINGLFIIGVLLVAIGSCLLVFGIRAATWLPIVIGAICGGLGYCCIDATEKDT